MMRLREHPAIGEGRTDILPADPRLLSIIPGYNVRDLSTPEARDELDELKAKVKAHGVRTALVVKFDGEKIWIIEGHKRHKVTMELIDEYEASEGREGRNIDFVPITAEKLGTSDIDRDFGLETSNSGARLKPLELANLIYRLNTQRGLPLEAIAHGLGKSLVVIKNHLAMRAMPEPVKEQVREGAISATEAAKLVKQLPAGTDPIQAAEIIKANQEENKRLGVGKKTQHKVTAKTLQRDRPKAEPKPQAETKSAAQTEGSPVAGVESLDHLREQIAGLTARSPVVSEQQRRDREFEAAAPKPVTMPGPRPHNRIESLLCGFIAASNAAELAFMYARLCRELEETKAETGDVMEGQEQLCLAADLIGELRFPDDWSNAKAKTELQQVA